MDKTIWGIKQVNFLLPFEGRYPHPEPGKKYVTVTSNDRDVRLLRNSAQPSLQLAVAVFEDNMKQHTS